MLCPSAVNATGREVFAPMIFTLAHHVKVFKRRAALNRLTSSQTLVGWQCRRGNSYFASGGRGGAGDGGSSTAESFAKICTRSGLYAFTYTSYQSVIRGGHMWVQVRASEEPLLSQGERPHVLICLNQPTADIHVPQVREGGAVIFDSESVKVEKDRLPDAVRVLAFPLARMARQYGNNPLMKNTVALGAAIRLFDMDLKVVECASPRRRGTAKDQGFKWDMKAPTAGYGHPDGHG